MPNWESAPVVDEEPAWAKAPLVDAEPAWSRAPVVDSPAWAAAPEVGGDESADVAEPALAEAEKKSDALAAAKAKSAGEMDALMSGGDVVTPLLKLQEGADAMHPSFTRLQAPKDASLLKKAAAAGVNLAEGLAEGMLRPSSAVGLGLGATMATIRGAVGASFAAPAAVSVPESVLDTIEKAKAGDTQGALEAAGQGIVASLIAYGGMKLPNGKAVEPTKESVPIEPAVKEPLTTEAKPAEPVSEPPPPTPSIASPEGNAAMAEINQGMSGWGKVGTAMKIAAGDTLPEMTAAHRPAAEALASFASSREWGKAKGEAFALRVLADTGLDDQTFGALMTEGELRGTRNDRLDKASAALARGDVQGAAELAQSARDVTTIIGQKSPIKTEAEYQALASDPTVQSAIAKFKAMQEIEVDPMHREAAGLAPDAELPALGLNGTHMSLMPLAEGEAGVRPVLSGPAGGNVKASLAKRSKFLSRSGTSPRYETSFSAIMQNKFGAEREVVEYKKAINEMVEGGIAVVGTKSPGKINGMEVKTYPLSYGKPGENIYIPKNLDWEFRGALAIDKPFTLFWGPRQAAAFLNRLALAGLVDGTSHAINILSTELTRPGTFLPAQMVKAPFRYGKAAVLDVMAAIRGAGERHIEQLGKLADIAEAGASRAQFPPAKGGLVNPLNWMSSGIHWLDKTYRLMGNEIFDELVKTGKYADTLTNRREFINQGLQYNRRLQGHIIRAARDSGLAPFVTAGRAMNTMVLRHLTVAGAQPVSAKARAMILAKYGAGLASAGAAIATMNYLTTKTAFGRSGTKFGDVDTGLDNKDGKHITVPLLSLLGYGRTSRMLGVTGFVSSRRAGLPMGKSMQKAMGDMLDAQLTPLTGPALQTAFTGATGKLLSAELFNAAPAPGPDGNAFLSNMAYAAAHANQVTGGLYDVQRLGMSKTEAALKQLGRLAPQFGTTQSKAETLAKRVHGKGLNIWIDDVASRANRFSPNDRFAYVQKEIEREGLTGADKKRAIDEFLKRFTAGRVSLQH